MAKPLIETTAEHRLFPAGFLLSLVGLLTSLLSLRIVEGANFWVSWWEHRLKQIEEQVMGDFQIFRGHPSYQRIREQDLRQIGLRYVSTRRTMLQLTAAFVAAWLLLLLYLIAAAVGFMPFAPQ